MFVVWTSSDEDRFTLCGLHSRWILSKGADTQSNSACSVTSSSLMVHLCVSLSVEPIPTGRLSSQCATEAHEIRAESTQNNHTELRDNAESKHQRETGGRCFIYHPTRIHPEEKHGDEMRCYCPTSLAQEKQDVMSFYAWGDWWTACATGMETFWFYSSKQLLHLFMLTFFFCLWLHLEAGKCVDYLAWASSASSMMGIDIMKLWIDLRLQGFFFDSLTVAEGNSVLS